MTFYIAQASTDKENNNNERVQLIKTRNLQRPKTSAPLQSKYQIKVLD